MEIRKEIIEGEEITYVSDISDEEIEKNDDVLYEDTLDLSEIISLVNERKNSLGDHNE